MSVHVASWCLTIFSISLGLVGPYLFWKMDDWWILVIISLCLPAIDLMISENPWKNIEIMKLNGMSTTYICSITLINIIYTELLSYNMYKVMLKDEVAEPRFDLSLVITVIVVLAVGDYLFYVSHKLLHSTQIGARLHLMHHCCIHTSLSTNLWFHPLDLLIEFFGPFQLNYLWWLYSHDTFALLVIAGIMGAWYSATHDENISNHHREHHSKVNSDYPIYVSYNVPNRHDKIKHMIKT